MKTDGYYLQVIFCTKERGQYLAQLPEQGWPIKRNCFKSTCVGSFFIVRKYIVIIFIFIIGAE